MSLISVIVPVYNVHQYLNQCVDSILSQDYEEFEVILIDDGSTDGSEIICDEYSLTDERIKVLHIKNGGVSNARNVGISLSKGEWLFFVDADDWISENALSVLHAETVSHSNVELVVGSCVKAYKNHQELDAPDTVQKAVFDSDRRKKDLLSACILNVSSSANAFPDDMRSGPQLTYPVLKLYKKSIIDNNAISFSRALRLGEDKLFNIQYLLCCKGSIVFVNQRIYYYRMRVGSASNSLDGRMKCIVDYYDSMHKVLGQLTEYHLEQFLNTNIVQMYWKLIQTISLGGKYRLAFNRIRLLKRSRNYKIVNRCIRDSSIHYLTNRKSKLILVLLKAKLDILLVPIFKIGTTQKPDTLFE